MPDKKEPWLKFYPQDWSGDEKLSMCSLAARGLLASCLQLMHNAVPYGHLLIHGHRPDYDELAMFVRCKPREVKWGLEELIKNEAVSLTSENVVYSRRMVRDHERRERSRTNGTKGGHPKLTDQYNSPGFIYVIRRSGDRGVKIGISVDPTKRISKIRQQYPSDELTIVRTVEVPDMGTAEKRLHAQFRRDGEYGEWFTLTPDEEQQLEDSLNRLKATPNQNQENRLSPIASSFFSKSSDQELDEKCADFSERYPVVYARVRSGAHYPPNPVRDYPNFWKLVSGWPVERLELMLEVFLRMDSKKANNIPGTPGQFLNMAPECDRLLRENGR